MRANLKKVMPSLLAIALLLMLSSKLTSAQIGVHSFGLTEKTVVENIYPVADVYAFNNYSRPQLKFDISAIPSGSNIISAKLWLYRFAADNWDGDITIYRVDDQLWNENITASEFNAQALTDGENDAGKFMAHGLDNIDVLNQVNVDQVAGHAYVSLRLMWEGDGGEEPSVGIDDNRFLVIASKLDNLSIFLNSRNFGSNSPYLEVTYTLSYAVSASISPPDNSGSPGTALSYTVQVTNTGNVRDTYALTASDNASPTWSPTVAPTSLTLAEGGIGFATLSVTIPNDAASGAIDNLTVTATGTGVSDSDSCIASASTTQPQPQPTPPTPASKDNTPPHTPSLISPTNGASMTDNTPLFDWSDVTDPSGVTYDLSIARDGGFVSIVLSKNGLTASTYTLTPAEALVAGKYYWRVRAVDGAGNVGSWSENWSFTVSPPSPPPGSAEILLITAISLILVATIAAIALYLRKSHIGGLRRGVLRRNK